MKYLYYPGCSLEGTAREYDISTRSVLKALDVDLTEIPDWTCCGASAAASVSTLLSLALPARNIAAAEAVSDVNDILAPCSACYLNLKRAEEEARHGAEMLPRLNAVFESEGLKMSGRLRVRHLLDVLSQDIGADRIRRNVSHPLSGKRVAPYYGCQCLRPYRVFDNPERPVSMNALIEATGAQVFSWHMGAACCGASHMNTHAAVGTSLVTAILKAARGADAIVTVCPMCHMNLEAYQDKISQNCHDNLRIPVVYLPQLLGMAFGLSETDIRLDMNLSATAVFSAGSSIVAAR